MSDPQHRGPTQPHGHQGVAEDRSAFLDYLAEMSGELSQMAVRRRLPFLAYLLAMVRLESERSLHAPPRPRRPER